jgi:3-methyladenine DNA glycosylase AlkD
MPKQVKNITYKSILKKLKSLSNQKAVAGMARYGINPKLNYGVSVTTLRKIAREMGKDHKLAQKLWTSGIRDAQILAVLIDDPKLVTKKQMGKWVKNIDSWDVCDLCCGHLFDKTKFAYEKALQWSSRKETFIKRAGFALMAWLAVHDKSGSDDKFLKFLPIIKKEALDERNYIKKAVNWALRQIGKRNPSLNKKAIEIAKQILRQRRIRLRRKKLDSRSARWIASDAIRELTSKAIQKRLNNK